MAKKSNAENPDLQKIGDESTLRDLKALAATREGQQLKKELSGLNTEKLLEAFRQTDPETLKARLKNLNADSLKKAMQNKDFLNKLK